MPLSHTVDPSQCCPFCVTPVDCCPHLLICMGSPGEALGGALADRLRQLWSIILMSVGDDPATDARGVYLQSWRELQALYAAEADLTIDGDDWIAVFVSEASAMDRVVEACVPLDEL